MDKETLEKVSRQVFTKFPYLKDAVPEVRQTTEDTFLLIYKGEVFTADDHVLPVLVRVVTDLNGKILKITSSH